MARERCSSSSWLAVGAWQPLCKWRFALQDPLLDMWPSRQCGQSRRSLQPRLLSRSPSTKRNATHALHRFIDCQWRMSLSGSCTPPPAPTIAQKQEEARKGVPWRGSCSNFWPCAMQWKQGASSLSLSPTAVPRQALGRLGASFRQGCGG